MMKNGIILAGLVSISLIMSCQSMPQQVEGSLPKAQAQQHKLLKPVRFDIHLPLSSFGIKQVAQVSAVKLTISNGTQTYHANGADPQGFIFISNPGSSLQLGADIPEGNFWVATLGLYINTNASPVLELKAAFHVPVTGTIRMDMSTWLTGAIVEELRRLNASYLNTGNLSDQLNALQAFVNALTGAQVTNQVLSFSRLTNFDPPTPQALQAQPIASAIQSNQLTPSTATGESRNPKDYIKLPAHLGKILLKPSTNGVYQAVAINKFTGAAFFNETLTNQPSPERLYGIKPKSNPPTDISQFFDLLSGFGSFSSSNPSNHGQVLHDIQSNALSLGFANPTGSSNSVPVIFLFDNDQTTGHGILKAISQENGSLVWSHDFGNVVGSTFTPVVRRSNYTTPSSCACLQEDWVLLFVNTAIPSTTGIYALRQHHTGANNEPRDSSADVLWSYPTPGGALVDTSGALSPDQSKLYVVTTSTNPGQLIVLNTENGSEIRKTNLTMKSHSAPAIGSDGTVYIAQASASGSFGYLQAFHSDGTLKWNYGDGGELRKIFRTPIIDHQNGEDIIYVIDDTRRLHSLRANGSARWSFTVSHDPTLSVFTDLLVGAEADGSRIIYVGLSNGQIYAIRDQGNSAALAWQTSPGGNLTSGLNLHNHLLYASTLDGGDGQFIATQVLKVSTANVPNFAPWPKPGGSVFNDGRLNTIPR